MSQSFTPTPIATVAAIAATQAATVPVTAAGGLPNASARAFATRAGDVINVQDWGITANSSDVSANLQALINAFPTGYTIHLHFPRNAGTAGQSLYGLASIVNSNGRVVRCTFEDDADILSINSAYLFVDRVELWRGSQHFVSISTAYSGNNSGLPIGTGPRTSIEGYAVGPNVNYDNRVITDTRYAATNTTTPGGAAGGQLALVQQRVATFANLLDATSPSLEWNILVGPQFSEMGAGFQNHISSPLGVETDITVNGPVLPITDQAGYMTAGGGYLMASGGAHNATPWGQYVAGDMPYGFRVAGNAAGATLTSAPTLSNRWPFYPAAFGATNPAAVTTTNTIIITDASTVQHTVTLNGGAGTGSLADVVSSINAAAIPNIQAQVTGLGASSTVNRIVIYSTVPRDAGTFVLANGTGTPLAVLGLTAGTYSIASQVGPYAVVYSNLLSTTGQIVATNSQMVVCGTTITLNGGAGTGSMADIAASINSANLVGVTAQLSSWTAGRARLLLLCFMAQQSGGLVLVNSTNSPLNTLGILPSTVFPPTPPHAWAQATSETIAVDGQFVPPQSFTLAYSLPTSNTTQAGSATVTTSIGQTNVAGLAQAINTTVVTSGWVVSTTLSGSTTQGNPVVHVNSTAGINIGMVASATYLVVGTTVIDVNTSTNRVTLNIGTISAQSNNAAIKFQLVSAFTSNSNTSGVALIIKNTCGGSLWVTDGPTSLLASIMMPTGQHWPGAMPPGVQVPYDVAPGAVSPAGYGVRIAGAVSSIIPDTVQWPRSPLKTTYSWADGIDTSLATFASGTALRLASNQTIAIGTATISASAGKIVLSGVPLPTARIKIQAFGDSITGNTTYMPSDTSLAGCPQWAQSVVWPASSSMQNGAYAFYTAAGGTSASTGTGPTPTVVTDGTVSWVWNKPGAFKPLNAYLTWAELYSSGRLFWDIDQGYGGVAYGCGNVVITNAGQNYVNPVATFNAGAAGTVRFSGGKITGVTVTNQGFGAGGGFTCTISDSGGGTGALAYCQGATGTLGVPGNLTSDLVQRLPDAIAAQVDVMVVHIGTNDAANGTLPSVITANLKTIYEGIMNSGKLVVAIPIAPRAYAQTAQLTGRIMQVNAWIRAYCRGETWANPVGYRNIVLADPIPYLIDGTANTYFQGIGGLGANNGNPNSVTMDGLHPSFRGATYYGYAIFKALSAFIGGQQSHNLSTYSASDGYDALYNPGGNMIEGLLWQPSTVMALGSICQNGTNTYYVSAVSGNATTAASGGPTGFTTFADNNVTWTYCSVPGRSNFSATPATPPSVGSVTVSGLLGAPWSIQRTSGSAAGTIVCAVENPWSDGQTGTRQSLAFSLGSGTIYENWQLVIAVYNNAFFGITASDLGVAKVYIECEIVVSNVAKLTGISVNVGMDRANSNAGSQGYSSNQNYMIASASEPVPYPNGGTLLLRSHPILVPAGNSTFTPIVYFTFDASGAANSATLTVKINSIALRRANVA